MKKSIKNLVKLIVLPLWVFALFYIYSCQGEKPKETQPQEMLNEPEVVINTPMEDSLALEDSLQMLALDSLGEFSASKGVKENIALVQNENYIVKIDRLNNGKIRFASWELPQNMKERPNLIMMDGIRTQSGTWGEEYQFKDTTMKYKVFVYPEHGTGKVDIVLSQNGVKQKEIELDPISDSTLSL